MIALASYLGFIGTSLVIEATPGPNMGYLAVLAASEGRKPGFAAVAGVALGLLLVGMAALGGLAVLVAEWPMVYMGLGWLGILYMVGLAWEAWQAQGAGDEAPGQSMRRYFRRGLVTNILNPKAFIFYIGIMPQFVDGMHVDADSLLLVLSYVAVATIVHGGIVMMTSTLRPYLQSGDKMRKVNRVFGILLLAIAAWLAYGLHA